MEDFRNQQNSGQSSELGDRGRRDQEVVTVSELQGLSVERGEPSRRTSVCAAIRPAWQAIHLVDSHTMGDKVLWSDETKPGTFGVERQASCSPGHQ